MNAYSVVRQFEGTIAEYAGAKYGVAVESCTSAIFLSLKHCAGNARPGWAISIPVNTYPSVPASIIHAGFSVAFDNVWEGSIYRLEPLPIYDAALSFHRGMYRNGYMCLSFHAKKLLPIGRGGMILTDDADAVKWLKLARFDGREECPLGEQKDFTVLGWNMYMQPEQAARGLMLFDMIKNKVLDDLPVSDQQYPDLSRFEIFKSGGT